MTDDTYTAEQDGARAFLAASAAALGGEQR